MQGRVETFQAMLLVMLVLVGMTLAAKTIEDDTTVETAYAGHPRQGSYDDYKPTDGYGQYDKPIFPPNPPYHPYEGKASKDYACPACNCNPTVNVPPPVCPQPVCPTPSCPSIECGSVCACAAALTWIALTDQNNCNPSATACTSQNDYCVNNGCITKGGGNPNWAFCNYDTAALCLKATCPAAGTLTVTARQLDICSATGGLQLYTGSYNPFNGQGAALANGDVISFVGNCDQGQNFYLCEKGSVINTDSVAFNFATTFAGSCPATYYQTGPCIRPVGTQCGGDETQGIS